MNGEPSRPPRGARLSGGAIELADRLGDLGPGAATVADKRGVLGLVNASRFVAPRALDGHHSMILLEGPVGFVGRNGLPWL